MKKYLLSVLLLITTIGYSQQATIGPLINGARTVSFTNPVPIVHNGEPIITNATGFGKNNGSISIAFGTGTYTYTWTKVEDPMFTTPTKWNELEAGHYTIKAIDKNGCESEPYPFTIGQPDKLTASISGNTVISCYNGTTTLTASATGGFLNENGSYSYYWDITYFDNTKETKTGNTIIGRAGIYKLKVTDNASTANEENVSITVSQNPQLTSSQNITNVKCKGDSTGAIELSLGGGSGNYSIAWTNDSSTSATRTNLATGNYGYTITDANDAGCKITGVAIVAEPSNALTNTTNQTQPSSPTAQDGTIIINATGGTSSYTYFFKKDNVTSSQSSNVINNLTNGFYEVWTQDINGCTTSPTTIELDALKLSVISKEDIKCHSASTGNITVKASGGKGSGYNYQWYKMNGSVENILTNETSATITGITSGTYRIKVNDNVNPVIFTDIVLSQPSELLTASVTKTNPNCFGSIDGTATVIATGGTPDNGSYVYEWKKDGDLLSAITTSNPNNLSAGNYNVIIKDQMQCSYEISFSVTDPNGISFPIPTVTDVKIFNQNTGSIIFPSDPTGGNGGYSYKWTYDKDNSFSKNSKDISGLKAGKYQLTITDSKNCSVSKEYEVKESELLTVNIKTSKTIKCHGDFNGELIAEVEGGIAPYKYIWTKNGTVLSGENSATLSAQGFGQYSVHVTDTANPEPSGPFAQAEQLNYALSQPDKLSVSLTSQTNVLCYGDQTGAIEITINGGTAPYTQQWTKDGVNYSTAKDLTGLGIGAYNVTVTDAVGHNCTTTLPQSVTITQPSVPLQIANFTKTDLTGFETMNGSIAVTVSGGNPNYQYEWRKDTDPTVIYTTSSINNLSIGTYHLIVKDANDCTLPQVDYNITQPNKLEIVSLTQTPNTNIYCHGDSPAEFTATVIGGVKEYTFEWLNTTTGVKYSSNETITAASTISKASNLGAGDYIVSIKDQNSNILFGNNTFTITQPNKLAFTYTQKNVSCFEGNNGNVKLAISGGIPPYSIICPGGTIDNTNATVSGLTKGTYNIIVTDANSCQTQQTIVITEPQNSVYIANQTITPTTGYGLSTGQITITAAGGVPGYTYEWKNNASAVIGTNSPTLNNIPAGDYSVLVTDANGCTTTNSYTVQQPSKPLLSETHLQAKCNGLLGSLNATANGGASFNQNQSERIYTYKLKNITSGITTEITGNTANFTNIADGNYSLTATDIGGIDSNSIDILFKQPTTITLASSQTNVNCFNKNDGTATVTVSGGTPPYTYFWKDALSPIGSNSPTITNLQPGNYSVEVRDNNYDSNDTSHCVASTVFTITQPAAGLSIASYSKTDVTGFNLNNGTITVNITGGTPNYYYSWYLNNVKLTDKTTNTISNLAPGTYKVVITDANLVCETEKTFEITEPQELKTTFSITAVKCFGNQDGSIQMTASGGIPDNNGFYTYQLFDTNKNLLKTQLIKEAVFNSLIAGNYYVQVTDANNNKTPTDLNLASPIVVTQPVKALTITEKGITNATCPNEADGAINIEVTGGTPDYVYAWINEDKNTNAGNSASILGLVAGKYKVTVTDKNLCIQTASFVITEPEDFGFDKEKFTLTKPTQNNPNWSVNIVMKGGKNDYKYIVKSSNGNEVLNKSIAEKSLLVENLPKDKYTITVTDNTGCTKTEIIDLFGNVLNVSLSQTKSIICNGDGANLDATATGGTGVISYTWFKDNVELPSEKESSIKNYGPGTYKVVVIDTDKIEVESNSITITQPDQVAITSSLATRPSCFGAQDGLIKLSASGGNQQYQYSYENNKWFNFSDIEKTEISGFPSGTYTFYVKDSNGCKAIASQEVIIPETPMLKIVAQTITPATGFGLANGAITITPDGGNGNYKYDWFKIDGTSINQTTNTAINLPAGKYYAIVTDPKGCNITSDLFEITEPEKLIVTIDQPTATISCFGDKSIQLSAKVTGGASGNSYEWFNENNQIIGTNQNSPLLGAGSYYIKVTDKNQNNATSNVIIINEPALITLNHSYQDVKCYGESNGSVTLNATGGSTEFAYHYKDLTSNYGAWIPFTNGNSTICSGLKSGTYTFQIKDKNGNLCSNVPNITVTISQPNAPLSIIDTKTISVPASGNGLSNGSVSITAQGGNGNYTYNWFKSDNVSINQTTNKAVNLSAGKYYAIITDTKGCSLTSPLLEVTEPLLLESNIAVQNLISCNGDKNGSIKPTVIGGVLKAGENYTYKWYEDGKGILLSTSTILSGIGKGSYYVIATDSNGNQAKSNSLLVTEPAVLTNTLTSDFTLCGDGNDWTINAAPSGGTTTYNFMWNTGHKTANLQNVPPANYNVVVTDAHGCTISKNITITAPPHLATAEKIKKPTCFAGSDASIVLTSSGGQGPYSYLWNTGEKSNTLSNASANGYSIAVTDSKGCVINKNYTIENPPKDVISLGEDVTLCFKQSLTINSTIADDKAKYAWTSTKGFTSNKPIITISEAAEYTLVVTNHLGCTATDMLKIESQNTDISAEFAVSSQAFINEKIIIVDISNPIADSIEWSLPTDATVISKNKDFAEISFSKAGEYELTLNTKKGNCNATQTKRIVVIEGEYVNPDSTDLKKKFDLKIYPNPSNGNFTVDVTLDKVMPAHVKVYSLSNNLIIDSKYEDGKDAYKFDFSLSGLIPGVYFVLVESQQGNQLRKIIIN